jgi:tetratricopeptide (TPR) repeat protein
LGNSDEAVKFAQQAVGLDPLRANTLLGLGSLLYMDGRYDDAQVELRKALDLNAQAAFSHEILGKIFIAKGKPQQALAEIEKEPNEWGKLTGEALVYHALGREQESNAALAELIAKHETDSAYQIAGVYGFRGDFDKSFEWLERAYRQRDPGLSGIKSDPLFKNLPRDSRYSELLRKMRLPA